MEKTFEYQTQNVCSRMMKITYENDKLIKVQIVGGCPGNTLGVSRLVEGKNFDEIISLLEGIKCPGSRTRQTSCPDQLCQAIKQIKAQESL